MGEWSTYKLNDFVMISTEVMQDLNYRFFEELVFIAPVFFILNLLFVFDKLQKFFLYYVSFVWFFTGISYFGFYLSEIHTFSYYWLGLFVFQGLLLTRLKSNGLARFKIIGKLIFVFSCLIPFSYFLETSRESLFFFGFDPLQTSIGTIGVVLIFGSGFKSIVYMIIPILWICFWLGLLI